MGFRPRRPFPFPSLGAAPPDPAFRPERPRPQAPDGLGNHGTTTILRPTPAANCSRACG
ncbi:hypothetical protein GTY49_16610 [Streptomyces sp. SID5477]|nr:hypothetical protein [Streptomyces sp. SID5477]